MSMTEVEYRTALENVNNPEWVRATMRTLSEQLAPLFHYNAFQHPEHAAVAVLSEAKIILGELFGEFDAMDMYEKMKEEESNVRREE